MDIRKALQELADEIKEEVKGRMRSDVGINPRVGRNTLVNSDLYNSVNARVVSENSLVFEIADHFEYVVKGWKRTGRGRGTFQDYLINIRDWIRRKNIKWGDYSENQMMWILAKKMFSANNPYTIAPRPFINYDPNDDIAKILPFLERMVDEWMDNIFNEITKETDNIFK